MALQREKTFDGYVTEKVDVLKNGLLGDYNKEGKYMISPTIIAELVNIRKYKRNAFNNAVYCVSQSKIIGELMFEIIFKKTTKGQIASATLSLLEPVKKVNGYIQNTIKTPIGVYRAPMESTFVDDACKSFNLILDMGEGYEAIDSDKLDEQLFIQAKRELGQLVGVASLEEFNNLYKDYFEKRMEIIKSLENPLMQEILSQFEIERSKIKEFFLNNEEMQYKTLNELLDKVMEWYLGINPENKKYEEEYRTKILPIIRAFMLQAATIQKTAQIEAARHFPRSKKEVLEQTLSEVQQIQADTTKQSEPPRVIDKSPNAQSSKEEKKPEVKKPSFDELVKQVEKTAIELKIKEMQARNEEKFQPKVESFYSDQSLDKQYTIGRHINNQKKLDEDATKTTPVVKQNNEGKKGGGEVDADENATDLTNNTLNDDATNIKNEVDADENNLNLPANKTRFNPRGTSFKGYGF